MDCDYEDKYVLKYGALEQDFNELQAEFSEVSALLQQANENKIRIQAEVKFLKKRAMLLRASMRLNEPYFMRNNVGDGTQYVLGPGRPPIGRMVMDGEFYAQALNSTSTNSFSRGHANRIPSHKTQNVVGVLKTSSFKLSQNVNAPLPPVKKTTGKRKISWQDEFGAQV